MGHNHQGLIFLHSCFPTFKQSFEDKFYFRSGENLSIFQGTGQMDNLFGA